MKPMIEIRNFTKTYKGGKKAVDNLNLTVNRGDIFGFIGHNGAGKTTTIKALVGILEFDGGDIYIDGLSIKENPVACKQLLAYIPDNPDLYDYLTGIQYLNFLGDMFGVDKNIREEKIKKYGDLFELTSNFGDLISSYSHGMKQKVAIIGALIHSPKLFVLDEPFVGLDPKASHTLKGVLKDLCDQGCCVFFSTHVLEVAEKLCTKIAIIKGGKLVANGNTDEVKGDGSLEDIFMELIDHE